MIVGWNRPWRFQAVASELNQHVTIYDAAQSHFARGESLAVLECWSEAVEAYDLAIAARNDYPEAWNRRGVALHELGEADDALASLDEATRLRPNFAEAHDNRGLALHRLNRDAEAIAAADMALALDPSYRQAHTTRGHALRSLGRIAEALEDYNRAVAWSPTNGATLFNRGSCLLLAGDFERGWPDYECRWRSSQLDQMGLIVQQPLWRGETSIAGKTILLHAEQGIGDTIQFCRYASLVADMGARVLLGVPPPLHGLMSTLRGISGIVSKVDIVPAFDLQCPLLSLPLAFGTRLDSIPARVPYLAVPDEHRRKWRLKLGARHDVRIGVAWAGNPAHRSDHNRSLTLEAALGLASEGVELVCLQRDMPPRDVPALAMFPEVRYFGSDLVDFLDTAALIAEMDLVISVDTSVLHLAGAIGVPVWGLLPLACDWRWLTDRSDSPWYPTMRLFRQSVQGQWESVIETIREQARQWIEGRAGACSNDN